MRTKVIFHSNLFFLLLFFVFASLQAQTPQGFNYQAMAHDAQGNALANTSVTVNLQILEDSATGTVAWEETHTVTTNNFGIFSLMLGDPAATAGSGSVASFDQIDWSVGPYFLKVSVNGEVMGTPSQLLSVPYAAFSQNVANADDADPDPANEIQDLNLTRNILTITNNGSATQIDLSPYLDNPGWKKAGTDTIAYSGSVAIGTAHPTGSKLAVTGGDVNSSKALFEVKRSDGQPVFSVYNDSIRMYVDASPATKGSKGGFAVSGFGATKGLQDYLRVTPEKVRVYIDQTATKGSKGGFAVSGFGSGKAVITDLMYLGKDNYFIGHQSGENNTSGLYNQFFGYQAGMSNTTGSNNIFIGKGAGAENATGNYNVIIGNNSGFRNNGLYNIFIGYESGYNNIGGADSRFSKWNTFIGYQSGKGNTTGWQNLAIGYQAGLSNQSATNQFFIGNNSGQALTGGVNNTFVGHLTGQKSTDCSENTFIGYQSGWSNLTGNGNTYLGNAAGLAATGSGNVFIGNRVGWHETGDNKLYIDNSSTSTPLIWGDFNGNSVIINGDLHYTGSLSQYSDMKLKKDITEYDDALEKIAQIRAVNFFWEKEDHPNLVVSDEKQLGVIAQEIQKVIPEIVHEQTNGFLSVDYSKLSVVLLEAVKEQQKNIKDLQKRIEILEKK